MMLSREELAEPLEFLPPVEFAFSYGSGVFPQPADRAMQEKPMIDYILGVSSPADWHTKNIDKNPHHYSSWLAKFGGNWVSGVAEKVGVGVHFNPFVPWKDKTIKYGVIGMDNLKSDITTWKTLYISGRLQKPISVLVDKDDVEVLNVSNLKAALYAALLLTPPEFTEEELYMNICSLSYLGDIRMFFAEDKQKVQKIVRGSTERFRGLYRASVLDAKKAGLLSTPPSFGVDPQAKLYQNVSTSDVATLVGGLPKAVLARLAAQTGVSAEGQRSDISMAVAQSKVGHQQLVRRAIGRIVRRSSIRQSISGFFAAGGVNAVHYVIQKSSKAWRSWIR
ncbi:hypothetical protein R1sor_002361 [Riccia sorocarpa]|uniref:Phosphatidate cytidylyltransferase, mitochondrial n=1 Tax=Riccia sorocarpa TaxID=122646 RepID=A0ABD3H2K6_9MARC